MFFKHTILSRDAEASENMQKLALKFLKGLRHVERTGGIVDDRALETDVQLPSVATNWQ